MTLAAQTYSRPLRREMQTHTHATTNRLLRTPAALADSRMAAPEPAVQRQRRMMNDDCITDGGAARSNGMERENKRASSGGGCRLCSLSNLNKNPLRQPSASLRVRRRITERPTVDARQPTYSGQPLRQGLAADKALCWSGFISFQRITPAAKMWTECHLERSPLLDSLSARSLGGEGEPTKIINNCRATTLGEGEPPSCRMGPRLSSTPMLFTLIHSRAATQTRRLGALIWKLKI